MRKLKYIKFALKTLFILIDVVNFIQAYAIFLICSLEVCAFFSLFVKYGVKPVTLVHLGQMEFKKCLFRSQ